MDSREHNVKPRTPVEQLFRVYRCGFGLAHGNGYGLSDAASGPFIRARRPRVSPCRRLGEVRSPGSLDCRLRRSAGLCSGTRPSAAFNPHKHGAGGGIRPCTKAAGIDAPAMGQSGTYRRQGLLAASIRWLVLGDAAIGRVQPSQTWCRRRDSAVHKGRGYRRAGDGAE